LGEPDLSLLIAGMSFLACLVAGRRSIVAGLCAVLTVGYFFGIVRANLPDIITYLLFDVSAVAFYLGVWSRPLSHARRERIKSLLPWFVCLVGWPALLFFVPIQHPLLQLLGFRTATFFLPFLLIGAMMNAREMYTLALWVGALNLIVCAFALAEFVVGIEAFYPKNSVTSIIYNMRMVHLGNDYDVFRIPATFAASAHYGMTMVVSLPLLLGALIQQPQRRWHRNLLSAATAAAILGTLMCASRVSAVILALVLTYSIFAAAARLKFVVGWALLLAVIGLVAAQSPRLQRFTTLQREGYVENRVSDSVNAQLLDLIVEYPLGNGLGGGGTAVPYFLGERVEQELPLENEYSRIMLEEGAPGLIIWLAFLAWVFARRQTRTDAWWFGRRLARFTCAAYFLTAGIGIGLFISIPGSTLMFILLGWLVTPQPVAYFVPQGELMRNRLPADYAYRSR
jgi:hypothetical protein